MDENTKLLDVKNLELFKENAESQAQGAHEDAEREGTQ